MCLPHTVAVQPRRAIGKGKGAGDEAFVWSEENIDKWIANPKAMLPDSPMSQLFTGIPDAQERADIIIYLPTSLPI